MIQYMTKYFKVVLIYILHSLGLFNTVHAQLSSMSYKNIT